MADPIVGEVTDGNQYRRVGHIILLLLVLLSFVIIDDDDDEHPDIPDPVSVYVRLV